MSRREDIDNAIWSDPDFAALSANAKVVYVWTFTNARCGMAGLYKLPAGTAAFEIGLTREQEAEAFSELERARFAFYRDGVLFVRTRVKHLRTTGENMAKSIAADVEKIAPDHPLRAMFLDEYRANGTSELRHRLEGLAQATTANPSDTLRGVPANPPPVGIAA